MLRLLETRPYLEACVVYAAVMAGVFSLAAVVMTAGGMIGRTRLSSFRAFMFAGLCLAGAILGSEFLPLSDDHEQAFVAILGGTALLAVAAGFSARGRERAADFGMSVSEGFFSRTLERNIDGVRSRLKPQQGGGRDDTFTGVNTRRLPNDLLEVETAVSLGPVRIKAAWAPPSILPVVLRKNVGEIFEGSGLSRMAPARGDGLKSWGLNWRFEESAPGAAARIFGRATPPLVDDGRRLYLNSIELRGGLLICSYERRYITLGNVGSAEEAVREFAAKLNARADSSLS
jgi:hypothetical protein